MNTKYREEFYRISRKNRLDGICITFEYGNEDYHTSSEIVDNYRLFIDYNGLGGKPKTVYFSDDEHVSGDLEEEIFNYIKKGVVLKANKNERKIIVKCLEVLASNGYIISKTSIEQTVGVNTKVD